MVRIVSKFGFAKHRNLQLPSSVNLFSFFLYMYRLADCTRRADRLGNLDRAHRVAFGSQRSPCRSLVGYFFLTVQFLSSMVVVVWVVLFAMVLLDAGVLD